ncbi:3'-5' exonuclease [Vibrio cholerae]|uniref:3'-5' exonuclease n=2 Tax=Vibrio cholerae TaxID=666 RepID=A0A544B0G7_VIBCL|nr:3'-5' exonuclease [Vibrio cholerae]TQO99861.1 3'-5' exonuclease [Vibrio cholerae]TQP18009.1 3'-5' exonuclease [Vibrio cholerae]TQP71258.1 3'-5' exonuclease [Vibrio cholerae]TQP74298.1 3'-5' exonuclease [Vibrio cholerae]
MSAMFDSAIYWPARFAHLAQQARQTHLQRFYAQPLVEGSTPIHQCSLVALDFETTGLNAEQDAIVSIGLVPFTTQRIFLNQARYWLVKPSQPLEEESIVFHGITHSELQHAQAPEQVLKELLEALHGKIVVVHFRHIEREFLRQISLNIWDEAIEFPVLDTLEIERQLLDKQRSLWQRIARRPLPSIRLGQSRMRYHLPPYSPHHALTDAIATAELFQAQCAHHLPPHTAIQSLWL